MSKLREFEIRLLRSGKVFQVVPALVDSEANARAKASLLCSELKADGFEVLPQKQHRVSELRKDSLFGAA